MPGPTFGTLANFTASLRKKLFVPFGLFNSQDNLNFIMSVDPAVQLTVTGTIDGNNAVFTIPTTTGLLYEIRKNGVIQIANVMYTLVGGTITFLDPYVPQAGDIIEAFGY